MSKILKIEELAMFLGGIFAFSFLPLAWWWFPVLLFGCWDMFMEIKPEL